ncbi:MAG TPA: MauE/DoxX family redox-associated membrane protein [Acidimicrobiales bacterium]|nr:MauE/DoxX family redox-associated membrane protein [Acidimicrobiales bacterium]
MDDAAEHLSAETAGEKLSRFGLAAFMIGAGIGHFVNPEFFDEIVPSWMPLPNRTVTHASGVAEIAVGSLLLSRRTAKLGAWSTLLVLLGVYPANVQMAIDTGMPEDLEGWAVWIRLPLQFPMFAWAIRIARRS